MRLLRTEFFVSAMVKALLCKIFAGSQATVGNIHIREETRYGME